MTYIQQVLRVIVAQICQTIGWHSIQTTPLELLVDLLHKYLQEITRDAYRHTELYNRTEPNLDDIALCFRNLNINLSEIEEYINYVQPISCAIDVPKFPVHKDSNLNFLKPGSDEVLTRPVHVNEYLPPIYPEKEIKQLSENDFEQEIICETTIKNSPILLNGKMQQNSENDDTIFKKPEIQDTTITNGNLTTLLASSLPSSSGLAVTNFTGNKKSRLFEEEGRPTREMSSVMMTSSGFISPAREGKLPDSKPPVLQEYRPVRTPSPKLPPNINSSNVNTDNNPLVSSLVSNNTTMVKPTSSNNQNTLNQNHKKDLNNLIDPKLLKKLKKKSLIDKEQRKRDKLAGKLSSATATKPLSKNKLLKQLQKQQQQQQQQLLQQHQQQFKTKYNINKEKLTKKQKLKQQREFNMMHHNISKNLPPLQRPQNNKNLNYPNNNMKDAIALLQQSAAIAAATGIPLAEIHQSSTSSVSQQQQQQFLLNQQQQGFPLQQQQHLLSLNNNRFNTDIKLNTEPDKNKLNIFKKITSTSSSIGIKKEHKDDLKSTTMQQQYQTNEQQLISLPSGTTITPTNNINNNNNNNPNLAINTDKKYSSLINDTNQIICVDDDDKINSSSKTAAGGTSGGKFLHLPQQIQSNYITSDNIDNNRLNIQPQQFKTQQTMKIPKKLKKKFLQNDEQPLNLSNDKLMFNNNNTNIIDNLTFKQQQQLINNKNMENYLLKQSIQQQRISNKQTIKEKKERIKKTKIKEPKIKNTTTSSTVAQQFLQAVTAAAAVAANASGPVGNTNNLLYPSDIRSSDNLAAINKKLMKIDTVMQPTPTTINKLLSPDDLNKLNQHQKSSSTTPAGNVNAAAAAAAANFFSKQYLSGSPIGSYIPQLFPFPLSFQPHPGLIPTPGLFPPIPPPPTSSSQQQSTIPSSSNIGGGIGDSPTGFNEFLPFPISNSNLIGNNLNIDNKIDNKTLLPLNNNKIMNNYLDNKSDINLTNKILPSIPQFLENKNYSNVAPLVPESMIQNYQLTKTKQQQSRLNKQQQQQFIPQSNLLPSQSSTSLPSTTTNLDFSNKNFNQQSLNLPLNKFPNNDLPIEISDDEGKIKSDDDNNQIKINNNNNNNLINKEQLLLKTVNNNSSELINEQNIQIDNKNITNIDDKKCNLIENRDNNDILSSDYDGGNTDYTTGGSCSGINNKYDKQQRKEHKKGKKFKDGKIKKKKDKKDKLKNKEKYDKKQRIKDELCNVNRKDKEKSKKLKKEKKKDKQRLLTTTTTAAMNPLLQSSQQFNDFNKIPNDNNNDDSSAGDNTPQSVGTTTSPSTSSSSAVPKLTLKLGIGKSPTPDSLESRKIVIKSQNEQQLTVGTGPADFNYRRDPSPELARISPLVTRPPKQKSKEKDKNNEIESPSSITTTPTSTSGHYFPNISGNSTNLPTGNISNLSSISGIPSQSSVNINPVVSRGPGRPKGSGNKNTNIPHNQAHHSSGIGGIGSTIVSGLELNDQQTSIHQASTPSTGHQPTTLLNTTDADGNQVWICPACGRVDDGTPMIGCDGCDAWYHWVCVGIQVPPDDNEDWYCRVCITKKQDVYESDKKKKRKKKNKTN